MSRGFIIWRLPQMLLPRVTFPFAVVWVTWVSIALDYHVLPPSCYLQHVVCVTWSQPPRGSHLLCFSCIILSSLFLSLSRYVFLGCVVALITCSICCYYSPPSMCFPQAFPPNMIGYLLTHRILVHVTSQIRKSFTHTRNPLSSCATYKCVSRQPLSIYLTSLINLISLFLHLEGERDGREKGGKRERERVRTRKCSRPSQKLPSAADCAEDASAFTSPTVAAAGPLAAGHAGKFVGGWTEWISPSIPGRLRGPWRIYGCIPSTRTDTPCSLGIYRLRSSIILFQ